LTVKQAAERYSALLRPELYHLLTVECRWSTRRYASWVTDLLHRDLLGVPFSAVRRDDAVRLTGPRRVRSGPTGTRRPGRPTIAFPGVNSLPQRLQRVPIPVLDVGLAVSLAVAITIAIGVSPEPGARRDASA
jgi:hypothetical protein